MEEKKSLEKLIERMRSTATRDSMLRDLNRFKLKRDASTSVTERTEYERMVSMLEETLRGIECLSVELKKEKE